MLMYYYYLQYVYVILQEAKNHERIRSKRLGLWFMINPQPNTNYITQRGGREDGISRDFFFFFFSLYVRVISLGFYQEMKTRTGI